MTVINGIDVLANCDWRPLRNCRVGLVTNHTGLNAKAVSTIDLLRNAPHVELVRLFGPEHGIRGMHDHDVPDSIDAETGIPVISLFGARQGPDPEHLADLDVVVFDIQDIGCRFYTYISTLGHTLLAAEQARVRVHVLDRPNPINGVSVEGPYPDEDRLSFTAFHGIPIRHGLTVGEMGRLLVRERVPNCDLTVTPCEGWRRSDWFDNTGLLWTDPSPNMRSQTQALLYPGVGLLEFTNLSVGRGTDRPFEFIGAPYVDPWALAERLNEEQISGVRFIPRYFTPNASKHIGTQCGGVEILVTDRNVVPSIAIGLHIAGAIFQSHTSNFDVNKCDTLLANERAISQLLRNVSVSELYTEWNADALDFDKRTQFIKLYD